MWRAFFVAIGISMCILGGECLVVDTAVLDLPKSSQSQQASILSSASYLQTTWDAVTLGPRKREVTPPEWAPWILFVGGAVVMLYSMTIAKDS
jgi:hypothetical protein